MNSPLVHGAVCEFLTNSPDEGGEVKNAAVSMRISGIEGIPPNPGEGAIGRGLALTLTAKRGSAAYHPTWCGIPTR